MTPTITKQRASAQANPISMMTPELHLLEWEPREYAPHVAVPAAVRPGARDALRAKLRDRYIAARFPGVARSAADLRDAARVIKGVRLYFGEEKFERAEELLELAIGEPGSGKVLRLARLELAYLRRDAAEFTEFARDFVAVHPGSPEWVEIARLGRKLAPAESAFFGRAQAARAQDSYGPWPDMPNWLQASWDLTAEILGADFHREMGSAR